MRIQSKRVFTIHRIPTIFLSVITSVLPHDGRMRNRHLMEGLKDHLDHEEHETEVYARKIRETKHSVVKLFYAELLQDSMQHAEVLNCAITYLATNQRKVLAPVNESREEVSRLMDMEEKASRLFTATSTQVGDPHSKSLLMMLALDEEQHYAMLPYVLEHLVEKKESVKA